MVPMQWIFMVAICFLVRCKQREVNSEISDRGVSPAGQTVFVWPTDRDHRNFERLAELMTQYGTLTGNCLNKTSVGPGEVQFKAELEGRRKVVRAAFKNGGITQGCASYRENFINKVYGGSPFAQYGYCNESSYTALCLATQAGFKPNEILKCETMHYSNDHTFTMVQRPQQKWCVMDRYDLIGKGNFFCNASWSESTKLIFVDGEAAPNRWYEGIMCQPLEQWLKRL